MAFGTAPTTLLSHSERPNARATADPRPDCPRQAKPVQGKTASNEKEICSHARAGGHFIQEIGRLSSTIRSEQALHFPDLPILDRDRYKAEMPTAKLIRAH